MYIANRRGLAKQLLVWGVVLYLAGTALAMVAIVSFQKEVLLGWAPSSRWWGWACSSSG